MHLYHADIIAHKILNEVAPYCEPERCRIAGSVRRRKDEVKDIELVCRPLKSVLKQTDMFGEVISTREVIHPEFERIIRSYGEIKKGKFIEKYMKIEMVHNIEGTQHVVNLDMFMPTLENFWRMFAIRTGSADFAHKILASKWVKNGWAAIDGELYLQKDCIEVKDIFGKRVGWKLINPDKEHYRPPVWKSEQDFFKWLGLNWSQWENPKWRNL